MKTLTAIEEYLKIQISDRQRSQYECGYDDALRNTLSFVQTVIDADKTRRRNERDRAKFRRLLKQGAIPPLDTLHRVAAIVEDVALNLPEPGEESDAICRSFGYCPDCAMPLDEDAPDFCQTPQEHRDPEK